MREDKVTELRNMLVEGVGEVFKGEKYKDYLNCMAKFHRYSFRNTMLILLQNPEATHVAGFVKWKNGFKRNVKPEEHGMKILAPCIYKKIVEKIEKDPLGNPVIDQEGRYIVDNKEVTVPAFKAVTVFDIAQTEGKELPSLSRKLEGDVQNMHDFFDALKQVSPIKIEFKDIRGLTNGYCTIDKIAINQGMSDLQTLKTTVHEIAHGISHFGQNEKEDRNTLEVQAESIAYVTCKYFGLETSEYSFGYIAGWSSKHETPELFKSLDFIQKQSCSLIENIEKKLALIRGKEKGNGQSLEL